MDALEILTALLPNGTVGSPYDAQLMAGGGTAPYGWSVSALPDGLVLMGGGTIAGTPATAGTFPFTVTVTDAAAREVGRGLEIVIGEA